MKDGIIINDGMNACMVDEAPSHTSKARELKIGTYYRHFKGKCVRPIAIARHSETEEPLVIYECFKGMSSSLWARPLSMFMSEVDHTKYPDVKQQYRFQEIPIVEKTDDDGEQEHVPEYLHAIEVGRTYRQNGTGTLMTVKGFRLGIGGREVEVYDHSIGETSFYDYGYFAAPVDGAIRSNVSGRWMYTLAGGGDKEDS